MKISIFFLIFCFFTSNTSAETILYDNNYRGIQPGKSSLSDVTHLFGPPEKKSSNLGLISFYYPNYRITINKSDQKVNTILIADPDYRDKNNIKIGFDRKKVESLVDYKILHPNAVSDIKNGITYHFKNKKLKKIVLAHEFFINPKNKDAWEHYFNNKKND